MAMTLRLPEALKLEAQAYAATLGLSINALVALALREYLDAPRRTRRSAAPLAPSGADRYAGPEPARTQAPTFAPPPPSRTFKRPQNRADPCPCGATNANGDPIQWKHCHGSLG